MPSILCSTGRVVAGNSRTLHDVRVVWFVPPAIRWNDFTYPMRPHFWLYFFDVSGHTHWNQRRVLGSGALVREIFQSLYQAKTHAVLYLETLLAKDKM